jgi:hypothetical protein
MDGIETGFNPTFEKTYQVKFTRTIAFLILAFFSITSFAAVTPSEPVPAKIGFKKITPKEVEKLTGKKLTTFEKIKLKIVQSKIARKVLKLGDDPMTDKQKKWAQLSLILGLASIALVLIAFVPYISILGILAFPAALLAIIFGIKSLKGNSNSKGIIGIVTGGSVLLLTALAIVWLFTFFSWGWG